MSNRIPDSIIQEVQNRSDIVEVISQYLPLKPAGKNFKALCPFHQEKTPSFMVSPERQIFNCFGCQVGGNVFSFLMKHESLTFLEALKMLADQSGVSLPEMTRPEGDGGKNLRLFELNELAVRFFQSCLKSQEGAKALRYLLEGRGLSKETIGRFSLGYASTSWDSLLRETGKRGFSPSILEEAGLALRRRDGEGFYDRFRNRIIFPIFNVTGKVLGFGGRTLDGKDPKYMNSPETAIYHKSANLYGLNLAKEHILREGKVVVVEGYLDAITPAQGGIGNVVASLGTALTSGHVRLLRRYGQDVVMVYDSDTAGVEATLRGLDLLVEEGMHVKVVSLPPGQDPDGFVRREGKEVFRRKIEKAEGLFDYKLNLLASRHNRDSVEGPAEIVKRMLPTIDKFQNAIEKKGYIKRLAEELDLRGRITSGEEWILTELQKLRRPALRIRPGSFGAGGKDRTPSPIPSPEAGSARAERDLLQIMLQEEELVGEVKKKLRASDFRDEKYSQLAEVIFHLKKEESKPVRIGEVINHLQDEELSATVSRLVMEQSPYQDKTKAIEDCINRIKEEGKKSKKRELTERIREAEGQGQKDLVKNLQLEYQQLLVKKRGE